MARMEQICGKSEAKVRNVARVEQQKCDKVGSATWQGWSRNVARVKQKCGWSSRNVARVEQECGKGGADMKQG